MVIQFFIGVDTKIIILRPKSPFYLDFWSCKVDARVIIIAVMQKFDEKMFILVDLWHFSRAGKINVPPAFKLNPEALRHYC